MEGPWRVKRLAVQLQGQQARERLGGVDLFSNKNSGLGYVKDGRMTKENKIKSTLSGLMHIYVGVVLGARFLLFIFGSGKE